MAERMQYWKDNSGKLKRVFEKVMKKHYPDLLKAEFLYTFRNKEKFDDEGKTILAEARRCGKKEQQIYGPDFEINVHADTWGDSSDILRYRIAFHELAHCGLKLDDDSIPKRDDNDHLVTEMIEHDIYIKSFKSEIELFGLEGDELIESAEFLANALGDQKGARKRGRKFAEELGSTEAPKEEKSKKSITKGDETFEVKRDKKKKKKKKSKSEF